MSASAIAPNATSHPMIETLAMNVTAFMMGGDTPQAALKGAMSRARIQRSDDGLCPDQLGVELAKEIGWLRLVNTVRPTSKTSPLAVVTNMLRRHFSAAQPQMS